MPIKVCPRCGHGNPDDFRFCEECGFRLPAPPKPVKPSYPAPRLKMPRWIPWVLVVAFLAAGALWLGSQMGGESPQQGEVGGTQPAGWRSYTDPTHNFTIQYPPDFEIAYIGDAIVSFQIPDEAIITLSVEPISGTLADHVESFKQSLTRMEVQVLSEEYMFLKGMEACKLVGERTLAWGTAKGMDVLVKTDGQVFIIGAVTRKGLYNFYEPIFTRVYESFTI